MFAGYTLMDDYLSKLLNECIVLGMLVSFSIVCDYVDYVLLDALPFGAYLSEAIE